LAKILVEEHAELLRHKELLTTTAILQQQYASLSIQKYQEENLIV